MGSLMMKDKKDLSNQNLSSIEDKEKVFEQEHVKELNVSRNQIKVGIYKEEKEYVKGEVVVEDVEYDGIREGIVNLTKLEVLDLSHNQIVEIPEYLTQMSTLKVLDLSYNEKIEKIPNSFSELINLEKLSLVGTEVSKIKGLDKNKSPKEIIEFLLFNQDKEKVPLNEAKILVLGDENSGKSSLVERIVHDTFTEEYISTKGIDIEEYQIDDITVKFWDFAGQEITYQVHNLFMSQESLYLLVIDGQKENDIKEHFDWLETIGANAGYPPVIIVVSKHDNNRAYKLDEAEYTSRFKNIKSFHYVSSKKKEEGIDELKEEISSVIKELAKIKVLSKCIPIKKEIEDREKNNILEASEFRDICKNHGVVDKKERANIRSILNDTGTIIGLDRDEKHVTNPAFIIDDIYEIIRSTAINDRGEMPLDDPDDNHYNWIIQFLLKNNIALKIDNNRVLIPSRLPVNRPENFKKRVYEGLKDNGDIFKSGLNFRYRYIHGFKKGILFDFIIQIYEYIKDKNPNYWANGLYWGNENLKAVVLSNVIFKTIDIHIPTYDKESRILLTKIREEFEKINEDSSIFVLEEVAIFKDDEIKKHISYDFLRFKEDEKRDKDVEVEIKQKPYEYEISELIDRYEYVEEEIEDTKEKTLIITEGKTDWKHLKKALQRFQEQGLYKSLDIEFKEYEDEIDMGEDNLNHMLKANIKDEPSQKKIFIFDRDTKHKDVKEYQKVKFTKHSNKAHSLCIPKIDDLDGICIEFYYKKEDLKTLDSNGRRLFLGDEFLIGKNGNSKCGEFQTQLQNKAGKPLEIIDSAVYFMSDYKLENSIALSKNDFAENILNDVDGFNNFDIENFKLIFDVIKEITKPTDVKKLIGSYNEDIPKIIQEMDKGSIPNFEEIKIELAQELKKIMQKNPRTWGSAKQKALQRKEYIESLLNKDIEVNTQAKSAYEALQKKKGNPKQYQKERDKFIKKWSAEKNHKGSLFILELIKKLK